MSSDELHAHQRFFARWVMQPVPLVDVVAEPEVAATFAERIVARDATTAAAKLGVYHRMYFARLHESLREDFPALLAVLGPAAFERLCAELLVARPSRNPSLRGLGRPMPAFLAQRSTARPDLAELARLELARITAFDAADESPLDLDALLAHGDAAADLPLRTTAGLQLLHTRHAIEDVWSAADRGLPIPDACECPGSLVIWKHALLVWHRRVDDDERLALGLLRGTTTLADLAAALAPEGGREAAVRLWQLLAGWLAGGMVVAATGPMH